MNLESLNVKWFELINANQHSSSFVISFAKFCADYLLYLIPLFLLFTWIFGDNEKKEIALKSTIFAFIALGFGQIIVAIYPHPRPFMIGLGNLLIEHKSDPSFPSDHMTLFSTIAISYFFAKEHFISFVVFILSLFVAWSRVYLGVHFPIDMIGGFILSFITVVLFIPIWEKYGKFVLNLSLFIYEQSLVRVKNGIKNN